MSDLTSFSRLSFFEHRHGTSEKKRGGVILERGKSREKKAVFVLLLHFLFSLAM